MTMGFDGASAGAWLPPGIKDDKAFNDKYVIERHLGRGGSGVVVCARHRALDARIAIKFLLPSSEPTKAIARFTAEARAAKRLTNVHVVRIDDIATLESGVPYMVMEYLEGADLERTLQETPNRQLPIPDAIDFVLQASEAVAESHSLGIVHRDLKPSNLFCVHGADGLPMIKVLDFGISKVTASERAITMGGQILGSPPYMSPEQYESAADVDRRTDIWSIGVVLYEFLTGQQPFAGTDPFSLRQRIRQSTPRPMIELRRDLPRELAAIVARCLEKDARRRYPNLAELAKALWPCAPSRSRPSVACVVRTLESPGCATSSLVLSGEDAIRTESTTIDGVAASRRRVRQWGKTLPVVLGAVAVVGALIAVGRLSRRASPAEGVASPVDSTMVTAFKATEPREAEPLPPSSSAPSASSSSSSSSPSSPSLAALIVPTLAQKEQRHRSPAPSSTAASTKAPSETPGAKDLPGPLAAAPHPSGTGNARVEPSASSTVMPNSSSPPPVVPAAPPTPAWIIEPVEERRPVPARRQP
jgi:serine/threonine protein kinase